MTHRRSSKCSTRPPARLLLDSGELAGQSRRRTERGVVLVVAIGLLLVLAVFVSVLPAMMRLDVALSRSFAVRTRAYYLARAGAEVALAVMAADTGDPATLPDRLTADEALAAVSDAGEGFVVSVELAATPTATSGYTVVSTGTARRGEKTVLKQTITIEAQRDADGSVSVLTWREN